MASTSGSVTTSPERQQRSLTLTWTQASQSIPNNTTTINWTLKGSGSDSIYYYVTCRKIKVTINGTQAYYHAGEIDVNNQQVIATGSFDVPHNTDGTKTFTIAVEAAIYEVAVNSTGSGSWTLAAIPRYATVSQSLSSKTETTITMAWSSDSVCDYIWYKIGNSGWNGIDVADGKSGTYTITGRAAGTAYSIITRVRRKDSQLTTDSSALSVTTYSYPYASSMPNFTLGNDVTIGIYNPLGRSVSVAFKDKNGTTVATKTTTGTSVKGFNTTAIINALYSSIPSAQSGNYSVACTYGSQTQSRSGGKYSVNAASCSPSIGSADYVDENATTIAVTGDSSKIVRTLSQVRFRGLNLAAQKSATVASCKVVVNGSTYTMTISGTTATKTGVTIDSGSNVTATVTVTDSRGLTASKSITVSMVNWQLPTGIITLARHNNYYSETDIKCDANYTQIGSNAITITYQCRIQGSGTWTVTGTLADNVGAVIILDNQSAWDVWITLTDSFGGTTTYKLQLSRGMPIVFFDRLKNSVGINMFPNNENSLEAVNLYENDHKVFYTADKELNSVGWYTFLKYNAENASQRAFSYPIVIDINIMRTYQNGNNESYTVRFISSYNNGNFYLIGSRVNNNYITYIRCAQKTSDNSVYFQIYYDSSYNNEVCVECTVYMSPRRIKGIVAVSLEKESCDVEFAKCVLYKDSLLGTVSNYVRYPSGEMVQWGSTDLGSMSLSQINSSGIYFGSSSINFPLSFYNSSYVVSGVSRYSTGYAIPIGFTVISESKFQAHIYDFYARSGTINVKWQAVGRWY